MSDLQNRVTTIFRNDTAQAVAAVKHLRGVERDEAKKTLAAYEQENAKLSDQLAILGKATAAIGAVGIAWKVASDAAGAHLEDLRLEAAAAGANVDRLRDSTRGLVETDNLLAFAGRSMHGVWKLNQQEMETVAKGTDVLAKRLGVDLQTAMEGVTEAVTKGTTRSLKELGIEAKDKESALKAFAEAARDAGEGGTSTGEKWQQASVQMKDAWDDIQGAIGELVVSLAPMVSLVAELVAHVQKFVSLLPQMPTPGGGDSEGFLSSSWKNVATLGGYGAAQSLSWLFGGEDEAPASASGPTGPFLGTTMMEAIGAGARSGRRSDFSLGGAHRNDDLLTTRLMGLYNTGIDAVDRAWAETAEEISKFQKRPKGGVSASMPYNGSDPIAAYGTGSDALRGLLEAFGGVGGQVAGDYQAAANAPAMNFGLGGPESSATNLKRFREEMAGAKQEWQEWYPQLQAEVEGPSVLEQIFGKPDDVTAMTVSIQAAAMAVDGFTQSVAASFEAAVTGSGSAIDAFKKVAAGAVHSIGQKLAVVGAEQAVMALVSLATGDWSGAARHGAASAAAFVTSGVAFKVAQSMGYGAAGTAARAPSGGAGAALGGGAGGRGTDGRPKEKTTVVMLGRDFGMFSDLEQRQLINQAIRQGNADDGGGSRHLKFR